MQQRTVLNWTVREERMRTRREANLARKDKRIELFLSN